MEREGTRTEKKGTRRNENGTRRNEAERGQITKQDLDLAEPLLSEERRGAAKGIKFVWRNGLLYRRVMDDGAARLQLVVPSLVKEYVTWSCHDLMAGGAHMGEARTLAAAQQRFFWDTWSVQK